MNCNTITFPSSASITLPEGMKAEMAGESLYQFIIENEELKIVVFEHQGDLESAITLAKISLSIIPGEDPIICMNPPEIDFDTTRVEIYAKNENNQCRQICGKNQGNYSWVLSIQGEEGILERRSSQIQALFQSLITPNQRKVDLSLKEMESIHTKVAEVEAFIQEAMKLAQVPGLSLAIIEKGEIIYIEGFGKTKLSNNSKDILPSTRFMIGSITKSMTTFLIGKLIEEGILHWNDRAVDLYPHFHLGDEELSNKLTLEDLVCASTGIPRHDGPVLINHKGKKAEDLFADLLHLKPSSESKEVFQYNNQLVAASGFIVAKKVQGDQTMDDAFAALLKSRLFNPMEMIRSTVKFEEVIQEDDFAYPHAKAINGTTKAVDLHHEHFVTHIAPAGAVWSTARDMANYALTELNGGIFKSKRIICQEQLIYRRKGKIAFDHELDYALGWLVGKKQGLDVVQHGGATFGFSSNLVLFPATQSGIIILTNSSGGLVLEPIVNKILSLWFNVELQEEKLLASNCATLDSYSESIQRNTFDLPDEMIKHVLGTYFHAELGYFEIGQEKDGKPYFKKEGIIYKLTGYRENNGKEKLFVIDFPFIGFMLEPIIADDIILRIQRGQEIYDCKKDYKKSS